MIDQSNHLHRQSQAMEIDGRSRQEGKWRVQADESYGGGGLALTPH
jgi:hypothetical protein